VWVAGIVVLVVLAGVVLLTPPPRPAPMLAAPPPRVSAAEVCREWAKAALLMADRIDGAFGRHARAHEAYQRGEMVFGPASEPGTVLWVWKTTLHERKVHSRHYRELRRSWGKACLPST
jgi:hypothetical protein